MHLLSPTLIASVLLVYSSLFSTVLIAMNKSVNMLLYNVMGAALLTFMIKPLVESRGLNGANYALMIGFALQIILLSMSFIIEIKRRKKI